MESDIKNMYKIMEYTYFLESISNKNIEAIDIFNNDCLHNFLYIIEDTKK